MTWKLGTFMAMGYPLFLTAKMKCFAAFAPLEIDTCSRTRVLFSGVGWATAAENATGRYTAVIKFQFSHYVSPSIFVCLFLYCPATAVAHSLSISRKSPGSSASTNGP